MDSREQKIFCFSISIAHKNEFPVNFDGNGIGIWKYDSRKVNYLLYKGNFPYGPLLAICISG